jgi:hypothetical protein
MSTAGSNGGARLAESPAAVPRPAAKKSRRRHTPGGATLGQDAGREARRVAAAILEVLAGARTPGQAAEALGVSLPRYFQLETRAMRALVDSCEARPRGRAPSADKELAALRRQQERLQRELARQQTLVRLAQRTIGLAPAKAEAGASAAGSKSNDAKSGGKKRRRRRPVVRALRAAEQLQRQSPEAPAAAVTLPPLEVHTK